MAASDVLQYYGTRIPAQYYNGTEYVDFEFVYSSQSSIDSVYSSTSFPDSVYVGAPFLLYYADVSNLPNYNTSVGQVTVEVMPQYSITNTAFIHTFIGLQDLGSNSTVYQSPSYDWVWSGDSVHFENSAGDPSTSGGQACFGDASSSASHLWYTFVAVDLSASSLTSGYSVRASFSGNDVRGSSNVFGLALGLPYVSAGASGSAGTLPPSGGGGDNITVNVDMSGVESRLDAVQSGLGDVAERVGDAVDGVNDIKDAINAVQGDSLASVEDVGIPPLPFDESTVDDVGEMLNDVPEEVAAGGFWWSLAFDVLHFSSPYWLIVPLICLLALMRYLLWRGDRLCCGFFARYTAFFKPFGALSITYGVRSLWSSALLTV